MDMDSVSRHFIAVERRAGYKPAPTLMIIRPTLSLLKDERVVDRLTMSGCRVAISGLRTCTSPADPGGSAPRCKNKSPVL